MVVARDDGKIEIYSFSSESAFPTLCFEQLIGSTVTGIDAGCITMANSIDIIFSCFDGKILALVDSKKFKEQGMMANENAPSAEDTTVMER
jgi:hypothetical protein